MRFSKQAAHRKNRCTPRYMNPWVEVFVEHRISEGMERREAERMERRYWVGYFTDDRQRVLRRLFGKAVPKD